MRRALDETERRRRIQTEYNEANGITPESVRRAIDDLIGTPIEADYSTVPLEPQDQEEVFDDVDALHAELRRLEKEMLEAAADLDFERAAQCRDRVRYLQTRAVLA